MTQSDSEQPLSSRPTATKLQHDSWVNSDLVLIRCKLGMLRLQTICFDVGHQECHAHSEIRELQATGDDYKHTSCDYESVLYDTICNFMQHLVTGMVVKAASIWHISMEWHCPVGRTKLQDLDT